MNAYAYGYGSGMADYGENLAVTPEARRTLAQAEARIAELERDLTVMTKDRNGLLAVAKEVIHDLEKIIPNHKLAQRANRDKIYDAHFKL